MGNLIEDIEGDDWNVVYRGTIHGSVYDWDMGGKAIIPYPKKATLLETPVVLMMLDTEAR